MPIESDEYAEYFLDSRSEGCYGWCHALLTEGFGMRQITAKFVPCSMIVDQRGAGKPLSVASWFVSVCRNW